MASKISVIAFAAEFFIVPNSAVDYVKPGGKFNPENLTKPIFKTVSQSMQEQ